MAGLVLGAVGSFVGGMVGGPLVAQIGWGLGAMAGNSLMQETIKQEGNRLSDLRPQLNTYGVNIPLCFGTVRLPGNVIYCSDIKETSKTTTQGGKGGPEVETTEYSYTVDIAIAICKGKLAALRKVYANKILIMDASLENPFSVGEISAYMKFYDGSEEQEIDPTIQAAKGEFTNANRGIAYVVFTNLPLAKFGNQIPQFEFEVVAADEDVGQDSWKPVVVDNQLISNGTAVQITNFNFRDLKLNPVNNYLYGILGGTSSGRTFEIVVIEPNTKKIIRRAQITAPMYYKSPYFADVILSSPDLAIDSGSIARTIINFDSKGHIILFNVRTYLTIHKDTLASLFLSYEQENARLTEHSLIYDLGWTAKERNARNTFGMLNENNYLSSAITHSPIEIVNGKAVIYRSSTNSNLNIDLIDYIQVPEYDWETFTALPQIKCTAGSPVNGFFSNELEKVVTHNKKGGYFYFTSKYSNVSQNPNYKYQRYLHNKSVRVDFYDDLTLTKQLTAINDVFYDSVKEKLYITYRISSKTYIAKYDATTLNREQEVEITVPAGSTLSNNFTANERKREFFNTATRIGAKAFYEVKIKFDSLNIEFIERVHDIVTEDTVKPYQNIWRYIYLARDDIYVMHGPADNTNTINGQILTDKASLFFYNGPRYDSASYALGSIVRRMCLEAGVDVVNDLDVSDLMSKTVKGLIHNTNASARQVIDKLAIIYNFENCESNGKLTYKFKGKDSVRTIEASELSAKFYSADNNFDTDLFIQRKQDIELPMKINVIYLDVDKEYAQNTQEAKRLINQPGNVLTVDAPVVLDSDEAKQIAERILFTTWIERDSYKFETNYFHADIEPSDVVTINKNGTSHILRITKKDESQGICKFEAVAENKASYVQNGTGSAGEGGGQNIGNTELVDDTIFVIMDSPIFTVEDKDFGTYVAVCRANALPDANWQGANVAIKNNRESVFQTVAKITTQSTIGYVVEHLYENNPVVSNSHENVIDRKSSIIVKLFNGELSGCNYEDLLNGKNLCFIGGKYHQFMNAELIAENTYKLSFLLQNRLGDLNSNYMINIVNTGAMFVLCDEANRTGITRVDKNNSILSTEDSPANEWRIWSVGKKMNTKDTISRKNFATSVKPRLVSNVKVNKAIGVGAYLTWNYSVLGNPFLINNYDVYTDKDPVAFDVTVIETATGLNKTYTTTTTSFDYLQSMYTNDLASIGQTTKNIDTANISFSISKKSAFAGNGLIFNTNKNADTIL